VTKRLHLAVSSLLCAPVLIISGVYRHNCLITEQIQNLFRTRLTFQMGIVESWSEAF